MGRRCRGRSSVLKDPTIASSDADLAASTAAQMRVRDDMNEAVDMINRLEVLRRQVQDQEKTARKPAAVKLLDGIGRKLLAAEMHLLTSEDLNSDDKYLHERFKVYQNLIWLNGEIGTGAGDVAGGADHRPTAASLDVLDMIEKNLAAAKTAFTGVTGTDVPAFNRAAKGAGLAPLNAGTGGR